MPNKDIEPATLRSLARRSSQLSYVAAYMLMLFIHSCVFAALQLLFTPQKYF